MGQESCFTCSTILKQAIPTEQYFPPMPCLLLACGLFVCLFVIFAVYSQDMYIFLNNSLKNENLFRPAITAHSITKTAFNNICD